MISAVAEERLQVGMSARLEPGTLRLRKTRNGESIVFTVLQAIEPGEEVWLVPLGPQLLAVGVPVAGAATFPGSRLIKSVINDNAGGNYSNDT